MAEKPEAIKYDKNNYRIHSAENKQLIKKSLEECGAGRSILIDNENEIIAGNGVYEQAKKLGIPVKIIENNGNELVVIKRTDLKTEDQKRKILSVLDNSTSDSSEFDIEKLENNFGGIKLLDLGIEGIADILEGENPTSDYNYTLNNSNSEMPYSENDENINETIFQTVSSENNSPEEMTERIIICYKEQEKEKLENLLNIKIEKLIYNIKEIENGN